MEIVFKYGSDKVTLYKKPDFVKRLQRHEKEIALSVFIDEFRRFKSTFRAWSSVEVCKVMKDVLCLQMSEYDIIEILDNQRRITELKGQLFRLKENYKKFDGSQCMCICRYAIKTKEVQDEIEKLERTLRECKIE